MHASYDDIISRISTPPIWYDEHTVPRYCSFEPGRSASIHIGEIALAEITCQECQRRFRVAFSAVNFQRQTIAEAIHNKGLHFGDPPSTTVVDCGPASDSALAWPVPDVVAARSTSSNGNSCLLGRRCADVRSDVAVPGR